MQVTFSVYFFVIVRLWDQKCVVYNLFSKLKAVRELAIASVFFVMVEESSWTIRARFAMVQCLVWYSLMRLFYCSLVFFLLKEKESVIVEDVRAVVCRVVFAMACKWSNGTCSSTLISKHRFFYLKLKLRIKKWNKQFSYSYEDLMIFSINHLFFSLKYQSLGPLCEEGGRLARRDDQSGARWDPSAGPGHADSAHHEQRQLRD